jgi:hypothetical protein
VNLSEVFPITIHKILSSFLIGAALMLPTAALAQTPAPAAPAGAPAVQPGRKQVTTIFAFKKELGMTDKQENDIKSALKSLSVTLKPMQEKKMTLLKEYIQLRDSEAPLPQMKAKLQEISAVEIDMTLADISGSRRINSILSKDQLAKWRDIQKKARQQGKG